MCVKPQKPLASGRKNEYIANYMLPKIFINISCDAAERSVVPRLLKNNLIRKLLHLSPWSFAIFLLSLHISPELPPTHMDTMAMHCNEIVSLEKINFFFCMMKEFLQ